MTDFNTLFQSEEFRAYRKKQIEQVGIFIEGHMRKVLNGSDIDAIAFSQGALSMARNLINLPEALTKDHLILGILRKQKESDIATLSSYLVRRQGFGLEPIHEQPMDAENYVE